MTTPLIASQSTGPCCPKCGGLTWDNRATKRSANAPDCVCRSRSCGGVIWPSREHAVPMGVEQAESGDKVIDLMEALNKSLADQPQFPRADANPDALYREMYIIESRKTAREWVQHRFELHGSWPGNLAAGCCIIEASASAEVGRPLNANERELIERVVRDLLIARETITRHDERARVLAREIL